MNDRKKHGLLMKLKRKTLGIGIPELTFALGVAKQTIYKYELGQIDMPKEKWLKAIKILKITSEELYNIDDVLEKLWKELNQI